MSISFWSVVVIMATALGFWAGCSLKADPKVLIKERIHEKVVFKDRIVQKVVYSTRTLTEGQKHVVDQKIEYFGEATAYKEKSFNLGLETMSQSPGSKTALLVGISEDVLKNPVLLENWHPHMSVPIPGPLNLFVQTNLKFNEIQVGLDVVF